MKKTTKCIQSHSKSILNILIKPFDVIVIYAKQSNERKMNFINRHLIRLIHRNNAHGFQVLRYRTEIKCRKVIPIAGWMHFISVIFHLAIT